MPADVSAKYYTWYMTDEPAARIVAYQWWPEGEFASSMTMGRVVFVHRNEPGDVWEAPIEVGNMPWVVAQSLARREGFNIEVAEKA